MTTALDIAQAAWPGSSRQDALDALWERTAFPFTGDPRTLYRQISGWRRAVAHGRQLCTFCHRPAAPGRLECLPCGIALESPWAVGLTCPPTRATNRGSGVAT